MNMAKTNWSIRLGCSCLLVLNLAVAPLVLARPAPGPAQENAPDVGSDALAQTTVIALDAQPTIASLVPALATKRAVFIGEQHDRYDHSLIQLEFLRRLHGLNPLIAVGMEAFQQPFQAVLDDYLAERIGEEQMLRQTEYYQRWGVDYRLVAPILRYAREHGLPVIALNVPRELTRKVAQDGIANLPPALKRELPEQIEPPSDAYRRRLEPIFALHKGSEEENFDYFVDAQLLWDEGMADRAARFLAQNPEYQMVILAGNQHVAWGDTVPGRLQRRLPMATAAILNSWSGPIEAGLADYLLMPEQQALAPAGRIGIAIEEDSDGVNVLACNEGTECSEKSLLPGDRIVNIDKTPVSAIADLRLALRDKRPGDIIEIEVARQQDSGQTSLTHAITLR
jgi:uncharacterized iron-regulated protein